MATYNIKGKVHHQLLGDIWTQLLSFQPFTENTEILYGAMEETRA
jgi:hypothetical protein